MLDAKKSEYQKTEKRLMSYAKCLFKLLAAISMAFFVLILGYNVILDAKDNSSVAVNTGTVYFGMATYLITFCLQASFFFGILYLTAMYYYQRFEFKRHRIRVSMMVFIMVSSLLVLDAFAYLVLQV
jgi:hypothetical protein